MRHALLALSFLAALIWPGAAARAQTARTAVIEHDPPAEVPTQGPARALVTLELFLAPSDGTRSARAFRLVQELRDEHPESIRIRYRFLGRSGHSDVHAEAAREAFAQGRLGAFLREAYRNGRSPRRSELEAVAERAGVDFESLRAALEDDRHEAAVRRDHAARRRLRVSRVPGLLVGGLPFENAIRSLDELEKAYTAAEARALDLVARGVPRARLYERMLREAEASQPTPRIGSGLVDGKPPGERREQGDPPRYVGPEIDLSGPHSRGPEDARVPVVLYCSFSSRYCAQMSQHTKTLRRAFPEDVRLVFKHLITDEHDASARRMHEAALCADEQGGFWEAYDYWLFRRSRARDTEGDDLVGAAESLGLDENALRRCLREGRGAPALEDALTEAERVGVERTPSVVVGGRLYTGTKTFAELRALVSRELAPGLFERLTALPPLL